MKIVFNAADHTYTLNGVSVPSVSTIIMPAYDFRFVSAEAMAKASKHGTMVHKTVELFERGTLNLDTLHPFLSDHLKQWQKFKNECQFTYLRGEQLVASERHQYCGTYDCDGLLGDSELLLDLKTGQKYPPHALQTAGYKTAAIEMGLLPPDIRRGSLYLSRDSYELSFHTKDTQDVPAFLGLRTFRRWKEDHKWLLKN